MSPLKSLLFDLDDTLIDWSGYGSPWLSLHQRSLSGVVDYLRTLHPLDAEAFAQAYRNNVSSAWAAARQGLRAPNIGGAMVEAAAALGVPKERIDLQKLLKAYNWGRVNGTEPFPDVIETLTLLRAAGLRFGIITNAEFPMALRDLELEGHGLAEFFPECRFSAADHGYLKPHPSIFRAALDCLDSAPDEAAFVGDDFEADIIGAKQAGLFAIYRQPRKAYQPNGHPTQPDATIATLADLPAVLDRAFPGWR